MPLNKVIVYAKQLVGIHLLIFLTPLVRSEIMHVWLSLVRRLHLTFAANHVVLSQS